MRAGIRGGCTISTFELGSAMTNNNVMCELQQSRYNTFCVILEPWSCRWGWGRPSLNAKSIDMCELDDSKFNTFGVKARFWTPVGGAGVGTEYAKLHFAEL